MPPDSWVDRVFDTSFFSSPPDLPVWMVKHNIAQLVVCAMKGRRDGKTRAESEHLLIKSMRVVDLEMIGERWASEESRIIQAVLNEVYGRNS